MSKGLVLEETMSGYLRFDKEASSRQFAIHIRAFSKQWFNLTAPREFVGEADLEGVGEGIPITGQLTIYPTGPEYRIHLSAAPFGTLYLQGKKQYSLHKLKQSLVTCPLTIHQNGDTLGKGEIAYRDPMWKFPLTAIKIMEEDQALSPTFES